MSGYLSYNDQFLPLDQPVVKAGNRGFQYGDGLFETMRVQHGNILFDQFHFERLFAGMRCLRLDIPSWFTSEYLKSTILQLCKKNDHHEGARIRLTVFRRDNLPPHHISDEPELIIESWKLDQPYAFDENGLIIDVYPDARKAIDEFSAFKTTGYLPYAMAAVYARQQRLSDSLVLNTRDNICDSSISNIFWIKDQMIFTPPLSEGCVDGIMRRYLLLNMEGAGFKVSESPLGIEQLITADEVFLTNVIRGMRPVTKCRQASYIPKLTASIFHALVIPLTNY